MDSLANIAHGAVQQAMERAEPLDAVAPVIRKLFVVLHGSYGNLFASKFATGERDETGKHDKGILAAMKVWQSKLSRFPEDVIQIAAGRLVKEHPDFPPNLPQFEKVCEAATPRPTYAEQQGLPRLAAPVIEPIKVDLQPKNDGKDWARRILYRVERGDKSVGRYAQREARIALGMEGKQKWQ
ncbi:MAG: hypothetical protein J0H24_17165 [Delftia acidovorans]|jgi:hypothetical protein|nr:hypothetical protein [Delftia acidovorans]